MKKEILMAGLAALVLLIVILGYNQTPPKPELCLDASLINLKYSACYKSDINSTLVKITNIPSDYTIDNLTLSLGKEDVVISDLPQINQTKQYLFSSTKLDSIRITPNIQSENVCNAKIIKVYPCDASDIKIDFISQAPENTNEIVNNSQITVKSTEIPNCTSSWQCSGWEECVNGIQRRECLDMHNCLISTDIPDFTKHCQETCKENWQCSWTQCVSGYTYADCSDLNNCGTNYLKPTKVSCIPQKENCTPDISCSEWTQCQLDYGISSLSNSTLLKGKKSRTCIDRNNCIFPSRQVDFCSMEVDVYIKMSACGGNFEMYNKLDNSLISEISYSPEKTGLKFFLSEYPERKETCS